MFEGKKKNCVKNECLYGFFPAAKDLKESQSQKRHETVRLILNIMRSNSRISEGTQSPNGLDGVGHKAVCTPKENSSTKLPLIKLSEQIPKSSSRNSPKKKRAHGHSLDMKKRNDKRFPSIAESLVDIKEQNQVATCKHEKPFANMPLIGYSCGQYQQEGGAYTDLFFRRSVPIRPRYFFVHPSWLSEGVVRRHIAENQRPNPFTYGWP